jgi:hypothetical protein
LLDEHDLASMRETLAESLAGIAVIQTSAWVSDGGGGGSMAWTTAGTFACRVTPVASVGEGQSVDGNRLQPDTEHIFTFEASTPVTDETRILHEGGIYSVTAVHSPRTFKLSQRAEAKEVR